MKYSVSVPLSANEELSADFEFVLKNCGYRLDSVFGERGLSAVASVFSAGGDLARNEPLFPVALPSAASELFSGIRAGPCSPALIPSGRCDGVIDVFAERKPGPCTFAVFLKDGKSHYAVEFTLKDDFLSSKTVQDFLIRQSMLNEIAGAGGARVFLPDIPLSALHLKITEYLKQSFSASCPILFSEKGLDPDGYETISEEEGRLIAGYALSYVEGKVPFVCGGRDSPRSMIDKISQNSGLPRELRYVPGGNSGSFRDVGVDAEGMISGIADEFFGAGDFVLEKISVPVPDLDSVRPGDFFAARNGVSLDFAVVTGKKSGNVEVAYADRKKGVVLMDLQELADRGCFHPRRFMKERTRPAGNPDSFLDRDFLSFGKDGTVAHASRVYEESQKSREGFWHWIPNTGEAVVLENISFLDGSGCRRGFSSGSAEVSLALKDRNYGRGGNSPESCFVVSYTSVAGERCEHAKFVKVDGEEYYARNLLGDAVFSVNINGELVVRVGDKYIVVRDISVRPESPASHCNGDSLELEFSVLEKHSGRRFNVAMDSSGILSCYDKKMLWRGNLYIDDGDSSKIDWNDNHPWKTSAGTGSVWGENAWNFVCRSGMVENGSARQKGDGGQVVEFPAYSLFSGAGKLFSKAVCYDCDPVSARMLSDSPFDFVEKMVLQKNSMREHFSRMCSENGALSFALDAANRLNFFCQRGEFPWVGKNNVVLNYCLSVWQDFFAPNFEWAFYQHGSIAGALSFVPGFGYARSLGMVADEAFSSMRSAGIDALGFLRQCISYEGGGYRFAGSDRLEADSFVKIADFCENFDIFKKNILFAVPGDVLVCRDGGGIAHVAVIQEIDIDSAMDSASEEEILSKISVIESSCRGKSCSVRHLTLAECIATSQKYSENCEVVRLKTEKR